MKSLKFTLVSILIIVLNSASAAPIFTSLKIEPAVTIQRFENMFQWGDMYLSGQPSLNALNWLKEQGVELIINLRTDDEMDEFKATGFDEEAEVENLGLEYISVPIGGANSYSPENLELFKEALSGRNGKVMVHCRSCGRVTYFMMAYLIKYKGVSVNDAVTFGESLKYSTSPLESLLGKKITMSIE